jgi:hypothetical protein
MLQALCRLLVLSALIASGCAAATRYQVQVNGYTEGQSAAAWPPGAVFCVLENQNAQNPLLEKEIKAKVERLLDQRGFRLAPLPQAQYVLAFTYGSGPAASAPLTYPDYGANLAVGLGGGYWGPSFFFWPGMLAYPARTQPWYDRWLLINVFEARPFREAGPRRTVWVGEARSSGASGDLRATIKPLLWAAFSQFGQNTGKATPVEVDLQDLRYKELDLAN